MYSVNPTQLMRYLCNLTLPNLYINLACLGVCLFVCLSVCFYPINIKTAKPIGPKFFVGHHVIPGKVYEWSNFQKFASIKIRFLKIFKIHVFFWSSFSLTFYSYSKRFINSLYPINVKTAEPIGPKFFVGHHMTPGKVYEWSNFQKFASIKIRFLKIKKKSMKFFYKIHEILERKLVPCFILSLKNLTKK